MRRLTLTIVAGLLAACAGQAGAEDKLKITPTVAASFTSYQGWLTATGHGSFAITEDGQGGAGAGCPSAVCYAPETARAKAISACEKANPGRHCRTFADNLVPVVPYEVTQ